MSGILSPSVIWPLMDLPLKAPHTVFMEISVGCWLIILSDAMHFYGRAPITRTGMPFSGEIYSLFRHGVTVSGEYRLAMCEHFHSKHPTNSSLLIPHDRWAPDSLPHAWEICFTSTVNQFSWISVFLFTFFSSVYYISPLCLCFSLWQLFQFI